MDGCVWLGRSEGLLHGTWPTVGLLPQRQSISPSLGQTGGAEPRTGCPGPACPDAFDRQGIAGVSISLDDATATVSSRRPDLRLTVHVTSA